MRNNGKGIMDMKKILVVDDSAINLKMADKVLKEIEEYKPVLVPSGERAFKFLEKNRPDLILLDIMMPEMDGFEVLERLRADQAAKDIPVVFLTADEEPETRERAEAAGVQDIVMKPFKKEELLSVVAKYC